MDWISAIVAGVLGLHGLALLIVNLTPTPKDDAAVATFYKYVEKVAGLVSSKVKE